MNKRRTKDHEREMTASFSDRQGRCTAGAKKARRAKFLPLANMLALAGLLALGIALLTVSWQSWKAATRNPVESLRYE